MGVLGGNETVRVFKGGRVRPLLQFDHDERVFAGSRVDAGDDHVDAPARERQLVLDEDLDLGEPRLVEILGEHRETA